MKAYSTNNIDGNGNGWMKYYNNDRRLVRETEMAGGNVIRTIRYRYEGGRRVGIVVFDADNNIVDEWKA